MSVPGAQMRMPRVKWIRLKIMKIDTAAGSRSAPKANSVSGRPMLATLEKTIAGTKAGTLYLSRRATPQAIMPEPKSMMTEPSSSGRYSTMWKSLAAMAEKISAGKRTSTDRRLTQRMSGLAMRP